MKYRLIGLLIGLLALGVAVGCGGSSSNPAETPAGTTGTTGSGTPEQGTAPTGDSGGPVAIVNDEEVPRSEYDRQLALAEASYQQQGVPFPQGTELSQLKQQIVQQLVQRTLVMQESVSRNITATEEEVQGQFQEVVAGFPDEKAFNDALAAEGLTKDEVEGLLEDNIKAEKLLGSVVEEAGGVPAPTEDELHQLYDQVSAQQTLPPFDEVRPQLEAEVRYQKESVIVQAFIQDLEAKSEIEILVEL
jgi:SurA-like protein